MAYCLSGGRLGIIPEFVGPIRAAKYLGGVTPWEMAGFPRDHPTARTIFWTEWALFVERIEAKAEDQLAEDARRKALREKGY